MSWPSDGKPRFVVTELTGRRGPGAGDRPDGLSCHVVDRAWNYHVVESFVSERLKGQVAHTRRLAVIRQRASELADRLNAEHKEAKRT